MVNFINIPTNWPQKIKEKYSGLTEDQAVNLIAADRKLTRQFIKFLSHDREWAKSHLPLLSKLASQVHPQDRELLSIFRAIYTLNIIQKESIVDASSKNCANLLSDAFMKDMLNEDGSPLEGNSFSTSMAFFVSLLNRVSQNGQFSSSLPFIRHIVDHIKEAEAIAAKVEKAYEYAGHGKDALRKSVQEISEDLSLRLRSLKPGESLLVPYGYRRVLFGGHAMLCSIQRGENGTFSCLVINTGDGIQYHQALQTANKQYYSPVLAYKDLPEEQLTDPEFIMLMLEPRAAALIANQEKPYSGVDVYEGVFARFKDKIDLKPGNSNDFITPQRAGSCTIRVLMAYMRTVIGESEYKKLKFRMKIAAIEEMLRDPKQLAKDKVRRLILKNGIESVCRSALGLFPEFHDTLINVPMSSSRVMELCEKNTSSHYPEIREVVALAQLTEDLLEVVTPPAEPKQPLQEIPTRLVAQVLEDKYFESLSNKEITIFESAASSSTVASSSVDTSEKPSPLLQIPPQITAFVSGVALMEHLEAIRLFVEQTEKPGLYEITLKAKHCIKEALLALPIPGHPNDAQSIWNQVPDPEKCMRTLNVIMKGFIKTFKQRGEMKPEMEVALELLLVFSHFQACRLDRNRDVTGVSTPRYLDEFDISRDFLTRMEDSAVVRRFRASLNEKITNIRTYCTSPPTSTKPIPCMWDYARCYDEETILTTPRNYSFIFGPDSGEWQYLQQFASLIPAEDYLAIETFFKEVEKWNEVRAKSGDLSIIVQALWAGRISGFPPQLQKYLNLIPEHYRQLIGMSLMVNYLQEDSKETTVFPFYKWWSLTEEAIIPILIVKTKSNLVGRQSIVASYETYGGAIGATFTHRMKSAIEIPSNDPLSLTGGKVDESRQFDPLIEILDGQGWWSQSELKNINGIYLKSQKIEDLDDVPLSPELRKIIVAAIYSPTLRAPTVIHLLKSEEKNTIELQRLISVLLFSRDNILYELLYEPSFGNQLIELIDQEAEEIDRKIAESNKKQIKNSTYIENYAFYKHLKLHILQRQQVLKRIGRTVEASVDLDREISDCRVDFFSFLNEVRTKSSNDQVCLLYATYVSMFLSSVIHNHEDFRNLHFCISFLNQNMQKNNIENIDQLLWEDVQSVEAQNLSRFTQLLSEQEYLDTFLKHTFKSIYQINIPQNVHWKGNFPNYSALIGNDKYEINLVSWSVMKNAFPLIGMGALFNLDEYKEVFGTKTFEEYSQRTCMVKIQSKEESYIESYISSVQSFKISMLSSSESSYNASVVKAMDSLDQWQGSAEESRERSVIFTVHDDDGSLVEFICDTSERLIQIRKYFDGVPHVYVEKSILKKSFPIPLPKQPNEEAYLVWRSLSGDESIRIVDRQTQEIACVIYSDGIIQLDEEDESDSLMRVDIKKNPALAFLGEFDDPENILATAHAEARASTGLQVQFQKYRNANGEPISFSQKEIEKIDEHQNKTVESALQWDNNPGYYLDKDQNIKGLEGFSRYLVVRNEKGKRKILFPIRSLGMSEIGERRQDDQTIEKTVEVLAIDLTSSGKLNPKTPIQRACAAYLALMYKDYTFAFGQLQKLYQLPRYSDEVLRLMGWIVYSVQANRDYHPDAVATRAFAGWLGMDNLYRNQHESVKAKHSTDLKDLQEVPARWKGLWEGDLKYNGSYHDDVIMGNYVRYLDLRKATHSKFRFDISRKSSRRSPLAPFEEAQFLHNLLKRSQQDSNSGSNPHIAQITARLHAITTGHVDRVVEPQIKETDNEDIETLDGFFYIFSGSLDLDKPVFNNPFPRLRGNLSMFFLLPLLLHNAKQRKRVQQYLMEARSRGGVKFQKVLEIMSEESEDAKLLREFMQQIKGEYKSLKTGKLGRSWQSDPIIDEYDAHLLQRVNGILSRRRTEAMTQHSPAASSTTTQPNDHAGHILTPLSQNFPLSRPSLSLQLPVEIEPEISPIFERVPKQKVERKDVPKIPLKDAFAQKKYEELVADYQIGQKLIDGAYDYDFPDAKKVSELKSATMERYGQRVQKTKSLKKAIIELANTISEESEKESLKVQLRLAGGKQSALKLQDCIGAFLRANEDAYRQLNPHFTGEQIQQLHQMMGDYLQSSIQTQQDKKVLKAISKSDFQQLGRLLEQKTAYDPNKFPSFLVFEHFIGFKLRPDQVRDIQKMMGEDGKFLDCIVQKIMGAGKTLVLGTLLSFLKADGYHLSVLIPPDSLFNVNAQDLKNRAEDMFGQRTRTITLTRRPEHLEMNYLRYIRETIVLAIQNREVLIVPPDVLQSIRNQYHALHYELVIYPDRIGELKPKIEVLKEILKIFKERAVFTFDEVDLVLDATKEHNFSLGIPTYIPISEIRAVRDLYLIASTEMDLHLRENRQSELTDDQYHAMKPAFVKAVVNRLCQSPEWVKLMGIQQNQREQLEQFLLDPHAKMPPLIQEMLQKKQTEEGGRLLLIIHQEISRWIPSSLKSTGKVHYGLAGKNVAIPFRANNKPNDRAEFSHSVEMMNRTFQSYLSNGLTLEQTKGLVVSLRNKLYAQFEANNRIIPLRDIQLTQAFQSAFALYLPVFDATNDQLIEKIQQKLLSNDPVATQFLLDYVTEEMIGREPVYKLQLNGTAQNLVRMPLVRQGHSGTVDNKDGFPFEPILEEGTNGMILNKVLSENRVVHVNDSVTITGLFHTTMGDSSNKFRALIDLGPRFKGVDSKQIALDILDYMLNDPERGVKGVLYWDDETEMLCCVKDGREESPIVLPGSDPKTLYSVTELKADELFVFFPHHQLTGADIPLPDGAKALYTVSEKTTLRDLFQGLFRMRKILAGQRGEGVITSQMLALIREKIGDWAGPTTVDQIFSFCFLNGIDKQRTDLISSACQELSATVEDYIDKLMLYSDDFGEEHATFIRAQDLFVKKMEIIYHLMYAEHGTQRSIESFLTEKIDELLSLAIPDYRSAKRVLSEQEQALVEQINAVKSKILGKIPNTTVDMSEIETGANRSTIRATEGVKQSVTTALEESSRQSLSEEQAERDRLNPAPIIEWANPKDLQPDFNLFDFSGTFSSDLQIPNLRKMDILPSIEGKEDLYRKCVAGELYATENFYSTVRDVTNLFDANRKPFLEVLAVYNKQAQPDENPWKLIALSTYDSDYFKENLPKGYSQLKNAILLRPDMSKVQQGRLKLDALSGDARKKLQQTLIPLLLLSGDVKTLNSKKWISEFREWASTDSDEKREFFERYILPLNLQTGTFYYGSEMEKALKLQ